ncbi:D-2-hydroxyacid dehydrogenase [Kurthia huakuii]|uniref:D-2-hydroxyacid dehydrogenase n=1 Tax=Kurthia huakuii TaxID=1421019 RepID=UPI000497E253|nr:D-2-hydroxyacid dehydrogenase [Kurthia huakuii]MBM7700074.1 phosphoglycerate dehydrogenase-like enzyme [Kurthia huakuii]
MIYFTFDPRPDLKEDVVKSFPNEEFVFSRTVDDADLARAEIIVTYGEDLTAAHIETAENLQWIMVASAGIEKMPNAAIAARGIPVTNVRGIHKVPMAESVLMHILAYYHSLPQIYHYETKHEWKRNLKQRELFGSTALILGPGAIGGEIGRLLKGFHVTTIGCNRSGRDAAYMDRMVSFADLTSALPEADIVISVLPDTAATKHLMTAAHFEAMKESALFLNFGRGSLVETSVLTDALVSKQIAAAVCDVFETEPLPDDSPLWDLPNMTVSPHVSSHSSRYLERSFAIFKPNLVKWRNGEQAQLENFVDLTLGY